MFRSLFRFAGLFMALASVVSFSACGDEKSAATLTSARVGPSSPSGYYLQMTGPTLIALKESGTFSVRVWDRDGNPASGVTVNIAGALTLGVPITTNISGYASTFLAVKVPLGLEIMTATLENKQVTVSFTVLPAPPV